MAESKKTYYIELGSGQIFQDRECSTWNYKIEATDNEIIRLRSYFDQSYSADIENFYRAHVPYVQYHYDRGNDTNDMALQKIYEMIHELGDQEAKNHIEAIGILQAKTQDGFS
ncbi:hypothetical protein SAMN05443252_104496 [Bacillus sp. OV322]|uniref:hydrolase n=1 Tax=Bacillus sp. OV322 TaxID=1882764 RepID=UPI0008E3158B|nr:hydrolase [Bacillus sp. OV322]SFC59203.1 hypothetical protein SAMN05443252_104496 [Bacillus sp. OV322]